jgi:hypothetical protein
LQLRHSYRLQQNQRTADHLPENFELGPYLSFLITSLALMIVIAPLDSVAGNESSVGEEDDFVIAASTSHANSPEE